MVSLLIVLTVLTNTIDGVTINCNPSAVCTSGNPGNCVAGQECIVNCNAGDSNDICKDNVINANGATDVTITCTVDQATGVCENLQVNCQTATGTCKLICIDGDGGQICTGSTINCGDNTCDLECSSDSGKACDNAVLNCADSDCSVYCQDTNGGNPCTGGNFQINVTPTTNGFECTGNDCPAPSPNVPAPFTLNPTPQPTLQPTPNPTPNPTTSQPTNTPTNPTTQPTTNPTSQPTTYPTDMPTRQPITSEPTTLQPTSTPSTSAPSKIPTTASPVTSSPTTVEPTLSPSYNPSAMPTTSMPSEGPTTQMPSESPTTPMPTKTPTTPMPSISPSTPQPTTSNPTILITESPATTIPTPGQTIITTGSGGDGQVVETTADSEEAGSNSLNQEDSEAVPGWIYIVIGCSATLCLLLGVCCLFLKRKKKKNIVKQAQNYLAQGAQVGQVGDIASIDSGIDKNNDTGNMDMLSAQQNFQNNLQNTSVAQDALFNEIVNHMATPQGVIDDDNGSPDPQIEMQEGNFDTGNGNDNNIISDNDIADDIDMNMDDGLPVTTAGGPDDNIDNNIIYDNDIVNDINIDDMCGVGTPGNNIIDDNDIMITPGSNQQEGPDVDIDNIHIQNDEFVIHGDDNIINDINSNVTAGADNNIK